MEAQKTTAKTAIHFNGALNHNLTFLMAVKSPHADTCRQQEGLTPWRPYPALQNLRTLHLSAELFRFILYAYVNTTGDTLVPGTQLHSRAGQFLFPCEALFSLTLLPFTFT